MNHLINSFIFSGMLVQFKSTNTQSSSLIISSSSLFPLTSFNFLKKDYSSAYFILRGIWTYFPSIFKTKYHKFWFAVRTQQAGKMIIESKGWNENEVEVYLSMRLSLWWLDLWFNFCLAFDKFHILLCPWKLLSGQLELLSKVAIL